MKVPAVTAKPVSKTAAKLASKNVVAHTAPHAKVTTHHIDTFVKAAKR